MLRLETQIGAKKKKWFDYYNKAGATTACTRQLIEGAQYVDIEAIQKGSVQNRTSGESYSLQTLGLVVV
jgi:hypothetical protein